MLTMFGPTNNIYWYLKKKAKKNCNLKLSFRTSNVTFLIHKSEFFLLVFDFNVVCCYLLRYYGSIPKRKGGADKIRKRKRTLMKIKLEQFKNRPILQPLWLSYRVIENK